MVPFESLRILLLYDCKIVDNVLLQTICNYDGLVSVLISFKFPCSNKNSILEMIPIQGVPEQHTMKCF